MLKIAARFGPERKSLWKIKQFRQMRNQHGIIDIHQDTSCLFPPSDVITPNILHHLRYRLLIAKSKKKAPRFISITYLTL